MILIQVLLQQWVTLGQPLALSLTYLTMIISIHYLGENPGWPLFVHFLTPVVCACHIHAAAFLGIPQNVMCEGTLSAPGLCV